MYANLVQELLLEDTRTYREMMRMSYKSFRKILGFIEPHITRILHILGFGHN